MNVGTQIRKAREKRCITQAELADRSGFTQAYISYIERGKKNPTFKTIETIATALNCSMSELIKDGENGIKKKTAVVI